MGDVKIQSIRNTSFGADEDTADINLAEAVGSLSSAFVRIVSSNPTDYAGPDAGSEGALVNRAGGYFAQLLSTTQYRLERLSSGTNSDRRIQLEVWEYTGALAGPSEFIVRHRGKISLADGVLTADSADVTVTTPADCVPFLQGFTSDVNNRQYFRAACTADVIDNGDGTVLVRFKRQALSGISGALELAFVLVEFTGADWTVESVSHTFTAADTTEEETLATATGPWATKLVYHTSSVADQEVEDTNLAVWPGASDKVRFRLPSGGHLSHSVIAYVIEHPSLQVQHDNSIDGGLTAPDTDRTEDYTVTAVSADAAVFLSMTIPGTGTVYGKQFWDGRLTTTTNLQLTRTQNGVANEEIVYQVVDFAGVTAAADLEVTAAEAAPAKADAAQVTAFEHLSLTAADAAPAKADDPTISLFEHLLLTAEDASPAKADAAATSLFDHLDVTAGESAPAKADAAQVSAFENLGIAAAEAAPAKADAAQVEVGRFFGPDMLVLAEIPALSLYESAIIVRHPLRTYSGRIIAGGSVTRNVEAPFDLGTVSDGQLEFADESGRLRKLFAGQDPRGMEIELVALPVGGKRATAQRIYRGEIAGAPEYPEGRCRLRYTDVSLAFFEDGIPLLGTAENFTNLPGGSEVFVPIPFGFATSELEGDAGIYELPHIDTAQHRYAISRWAIEDPFNIYQQLPDDEAPTLLASGFSIVTENQTIEGVDYQLVFLEFASARPDGARYFCDCRGILAEGGSVAETNPARVLQRALQLLAGKQGNQLNLARFADIATECDARGYSAGGVFDAQLTIRAALSQIASSFQLYLYQDADGLLSVNLVGRPNPEQQSFDDLLRILKESVLQAHADPAYNLIEYKFNFVSHTGEYATTREEKDLPAQAEIGRVDRLSVELPFVRDLNTATQVVGDILAVVSLKSHRFECDLPMPLVLPGLDITETQLVTHWAGIAESGGYVGREVMLTEIAHDVENLKTRVKGVVLARPPQAPVASVLQVQWARNAWPGPWQFGAGVFFMVFLEAGDPTKINVWRTINWGRGWSKMDVANRPALGSDVGSYSSRAQGGKIHIVAQETGNDRRVSYHRFDMASGTWGIVDELIHTPPVVDPPTNSVVDVGVTRDSGIPVAAFMGQKHDPGPGGVHARAWWSHRSGGSWAIAERLGEDTFDGFYKLGRWEQGKGDRMHLFLTRDPDFGAADEMVITIREGLILGGELRVFDRFGLEFPATHSFGQTARHEFAGGAVHVFAPFLNTGGFGTQSALVEISSGDTPVIQGAPYVVGGSGEVVLQGEAVPQGSTRYPHFGFAVIGSTLYQLGSARGLGAGSAGNTYVRTRAVGAVQGAFSPPGSKLDQLGYEANLPQKFNFTVFEFGGRTWVMSVWWQSFSSANAQALRNAGFDIPGTVATLTELVDLTRDLPRTLPTHGEDELVAFLVGQGP